jgi:hypothetical protein
VRTSDNDGSVSDYDCSVSDNNDCCPDNYNDCSVSDNNDCCPDYYYNDNYNNDACASRLPGGWCRS